MRAARRVRTPATCLRNATVPRLSLIGVAASEAMSARRSRTSSLSLLPSRTSASLFDQQGTRCDGTQRHPGFGHDALGVECEADTRADHGNVHFRAGNEPEIGAASAWQGLGQKRPRETNSPLARMVFPGAFAMVSTGTSRGALVAYDTRGCANGDKRRNTVCGRGGIAEVADHGCATLNLGGTNELDSFDNAGATSSRPWRARPVLNRLPRRRS